MAVACDRQIAAYRGPQQRRAAGEVDGSDESLLLEETSAEAAWPRSETTGGGRARRAPRMLHFAEGEGR